MSTRIAHVREKHGSLPVREIFSVVCSRFGLTPEDFRTTSAQQAETITDACMLYFLLAEEHGDPSETRTQIAAVCGRQLIDVLMLRSQTTTRLGRLVDALRDDSFAQKYHELLYDLHDRLIELKDASKTVSAVDGPRLDPNNPEQIRLVLESNRALSDVSIPSYLPFRHLMFDHELFEGSGSELLHYCGAEMNKLGYVVFMYRFFPEAASDLYADYQYAGAQVKIDTGSCRTDGEQMVKSLRKGRGRDENFAQGWRAVGGHEPFDDPCMEYLLKVRLVKEPPLFLAISQALNSLSSRERKVLQMRFGLGGKRERTLDEIGAIFSLSRAWITQLERRALRILRWSDHAEVLRSYFEEL